MRFEILTHFSDNRPPSLEAFDSAAAALAFGRAAYRLPELGAVAVDFRDNETGGTARLVNLDERN